MSPEICSHNNKYFFFCTKTWNQVNALVIYYKHGIPSSLHNQDPFETHLAPFLLVYSKEWANLVQEPRGLLSPAQSKGALSWSACSGHVDGSLVLCTVNSWSYLEPWVLPHHNNPAENPHSCLSSTHQGQRWSLKNMAHTPVAMHHGRWGGSMGDISGGCGPVVPSSLWTLSACDLSSLSLLFVEGKPLSGGPHLLQINKACLWARTWPQCKTAPGTKEPLLADDIYLLHK